jgi:hypothetical protein
MIRKQEKMPEKTMMTKTDGAFPFLFETQRFRTRSPHAGTVANAYDEAAGVN